MGEASVKNRHSVIGWESEQNSSLHYEKFYIKFLRVASARHA